MAHTHPVVDSDSRFVINSTTRAISTTSDKLELIQGDHQSERITFEIPKIVEGHDMSLSDRIEVHYINIDRRTKATSRDIYIADDMAVDGDKLTFSWLISGNATKYYGRLNFIILFECLDSDGNYTYKWNTEICKLLTIGEGISNTKAVAEDYSDILEKFKNEILGEAAEGTVKFTEQTLTDDEKKQARTNIGAQEWICGSEDYPEETICEFWSNNGSTVDLSKKLEAGKTYLVYEGVDRSNVKEVTATVGGGYVSLRMYYNNAPIGVLMCPENWPESPAEYGGNTSDNHRYTVTIPAHTEIEQIPDKYIPISQPDWNQNDATAKDHIKNRICYSEEFPSADIIVGLQGNAGTLRDLVPLETELREGVHYSTYVSPYPYGEAVCIKGTYKNTECLILNVTKDGSSSAPDVVLYTPIDWVDKKRANCEFLSDISGSGLTITQYKQTVYHQIDEKYLPHIPLIVTITKNADSTYSSDKRSEEIYAAYKNGAYIEVRYSWLPIIGYLYAANPSFVMLMVDLKSRELFGAITNYVVTIIESNHVAVSEVDNPLIIPPAGTKTGSVWTIDATDGPKWMAPADQTNVIINSSTEGSTKKFKITVNDAGTITAMEVTESTV